MAKVQGFKVVKEGLVSLSDVYSVTPMQKGIDGIGNYMLPAVGKIFTDSNAVQAEFHKSLMSGELRKLIEEGAIEPVEVESTSVNMPEFNVNNKVAERDLAEMTVEQLEKILEAKKKTKLIKEIAETQKENTEKIGASVEANPTASTGTEQPTEKSESKKSYEIDPLLKDFSGLSYQDKLTYISKCDDKATLKAIVNSDVEISVIKKRALDKLAK